MGQMEISSRKRKKRQDIQNAVLATIAIAGLLAWTAVAPNTLQLLRYLPKEKWNLAYPPPTTP